MNKIVFYYLTLFSLVVAFSAYTLFQGSLVVHHGQTVADLEAEKKVLLAKQATLQQELSQAESLATIKALAEDQNFQPIAQTVAVSQTKSVATLP